ncbi:hypothetical protein CCP1ISM_3130002 [Azospirillaceae bacterium]
MIAILPVGETAETVTLCRADYEALIEALEDAEDIAALNAAGRHEAETGKAAARADHVSLEQVERLLKKV